MPPPSGAPRPSPPSPPSRQLAPAVPLGPGPGVPVRPPVTVSRLRVTDAAPETNITRSPIADASIVVFDRPAPMMRIGPWVVMSRSPVSFPSPAWGAIDRLYRPDPSTIVFEPDVEVPHPEEKPGRSTASIAARSVHPPPGGARPSTVVVTFSVAA